MEKALLFIETRSVVLVMLALLAAGGAYAFATLQDTHGTEEVMVLARGPFVQEVSVSGKVVASGEVDLGFAQGGRVKMVRAAVGDTVARGDILAEVENDDARAVVLQRKAALLTEEANLRLLVEGARSEEIAVKEAAVKSAEVSLGQTRQALVEEIQEAYRAADDAVHVQADQFFDTPRSAQPRLTFNTTNSQGKAALENQRLALEDTLSSWATEAFLSASVGELGEKFAHAQANLTKVAAFLAASQTTLDEALASQTVTTAMIESYVADIAAARTSINAAITALTTADTAFKSADAARDSAEKNLALLKAAATPSTVAAQEAKVEAARAQVLDAEAQFRKTFISAPLSGVVTSVDLEVGEVAAPHAPVVSVISGSAYRLESYVPEINIALVAVDDPAIVTLDAYGETVAFPAHVVSIDPAETIRDGLSTYRAILQFTENDPRVKTGMTANVVITTEKKDNVLAVPQGIVTTENGRQYVPVKTGDSVVAREVTTGAVSSLGMVEILSGLSEGDVVVLTN